LIFSLKKDDIFWWPAIQSIELNKSSRFSGRKLTHKTAQFLFFRIFPAALVRQAIPSS